MTVGLVATSTRERYEKLHRRIVIAARRDAFSPHKGRPWLRSVAFRDALTGLVGRLNAFELTWNILVARNVAIRANGYVSLSFVFLVTFAS